MIFIGLHIDDLSFNDRRKESFVVRKQRKRPGYIHSSPGCAQFKNAVRFEIGSEIT